MRDIRGRMLRLEKLYPPPPPPARAASPRIDWEAVTAAITAGDGSHLSGDDRRAYELLRPYRGPFLSVRWPDSPPPEVPRPAGAAGRDPLPSAEALWMYADGLKAREEVSGATGRRRDCHGGDLDEHHGHDEGAELYAVRVIGLWRSGKLQAGEHLPGASDAGKAAAERLWRARRAAGL